MLVYLQPLDIIVCVDDAKGGGDSKCPDCSLCGDMTAERTVCYHKSTSNGDEDQQNNEIASHSMVNEVSVTDRGNKLEDGEESCRKNAGEVDNDSNTVPWHRIPVAFAGSRTTSCALQIAENAVKGKKLKSSKTEAQ